MQMKGPSQFEMKLKLEELCQNTTKKIRVTRKVVFKNTKERIPDDKVDIARGICKSCNGQGMITRESNKTRYGSTNTSTL